MCVCVCAQDGMTGGEEELKWESQAEKQQPLIAGETSFGCGLCVIRGLGGVPHCARIYIRCQILFTLKKQAGVVSLTVVTDVLFYPDVEGRRNGRQVLGLW